VALEFYHPDDRADVRAAIDRAMESGTETRGTWRLRTAEGRKRIVDVTMIPVSDDDDVSLVRGSVHDVTERREREHRFRAFVERSTDVISIVDADGRFTYQSPSLERVLGYAPEETLGDLAFAYMHPDDRAAIVEQFERLVDEPDATPVMEYRACHADGSWRWIEARGNNQLSNPAVRGYVVNSRDITDRKEREEELRRIRARYRALVENVPAVVFLFDEELRYRLADGTDLAGLDPSIEDVEGATPRDLFPDAVAADVTEHYRAALDGTPQSFERAWDGRRYRVRALPIRDDDGDVVSGLDISWPVSE
jgi:PAS domain S-box-containing protein